MQKFNDEVVSKWKLSKRSAFVFAAVVDPDATSEAADMTKLGPKCKRQVLVQNTKYQVTTE